MNMTPKRSSEQEPAVSLEVNYERHRRLAPVTGLDVAGKRRRQVAGLDSSDMPGVPTTTRQQERPERKPVQGQ